MECFLIVARCEAFQKHSPNPWRIALSVSRVNLGCRAKHRMGLHFVVGSSEAEITYCKSYFAGRENFPNPYETLYIFLVFSSSPLSENPLGVVFTCFSAAKIIVLVRFIIKWLFYNSTLILCPLLSIHLILIFSKLLLKLYFCPDFLSSTRIFRLWDF